jgi:hypothetical protein
MKTHARILSLALVAASLCLGTAAKADIYIRESDHVVLRNYVTAPAPTETITFYTIGNELPQMTTYAELPTVVTSQLATPPAGAIYVSANGNVYLIDRRTRRILDAVQLY